MINFNKLGSTYESNMKNAVLVPHLIVIVLARQQHDVWFWPESLKTDSHSAILSMVVRAWVGASKGTDDHVLPEKDS